MKFSLSDINPKFLAANAEALRAQGVDVSKLGLVAKTAKLGQQAANGAADMALMMGAKKTRKTLAESRLEMANGKTIAAKGGASGAVRGLAGKQIGMIVSDDPMKQGEPVFIGADYASKPDETKKFLFIDEVAHWSGEKIEPRYRSKWEREWHQILKTRGYSYCEFEPLSLNLAKGSRYTPDFITIEHTKDEHGRPVRVQTAWEVKGFWREAAKVRIKVAARLFPWLRFVAVKKRKKKLGGGWEEQVFTP